MSTKHRPPKLTRREIILEALIVTLASGAAAVILLLYLGVKTGLVDVLSLESRWVVAAAVGVGLVSLLFRYCGTGKLRR